MTALKRRADERKGSNNNSLKHPPHSLDQTSATLSCRGEGNMRLGAPALNYRHRCWNMYHPSTLLTSHCSIPFPQPLLVPRFPDLLLLHALLPSLLHYALSTSHCSKSSPHPVPAAPLPILCSSTPSSLPCCCTFSPPFLPAAPLPIPCSSSHSSLSCCCTFSLPSCCTPSPFPRAARLFLSPQSTLLTPLVSPQPAASRPETARHVLGARYRSSTTLAWLAALIREAPRGVHTYLFLCSRRGIQATQTPSSLRYMLKK